jgi:hypothetical protein
MNRFIYLLAVFIVSFISLVFFRPPAQSIANNPSGIIHISAHYSAKKRNLVDVSIGGIKVWMTLQQVTSKLGKPSKISQILDPCTGQKRITLRYYKLVITVLGETVIQIENYNPLYQTREKIKVTTQA